ncbi:tudor domain-containing protein 1 [Topomyia yanbarensis]|uniref:tudor domain-containing protein 1 n=1 Tax=Topomyia yanbarensis TaxID=2498891 RepID=UPI00273B1E93|nr:tudor domain-containing protein 1 [Topomyia yanbarensis]
MAGLDEEYDQMQRDYCDPLLNRYDRGPGADLDDRQQPGALAAAAARTTSSVGGEGSGMAFNYPPAVRIHLKNTQDLTADGLIQLCRPYGTVVSVHKPKDNANYAFVEFANQSEAGLAIQELNRKLGFQFYPTFAHEKKSLPMEAESFPAPPPPFESAPGERLIPRLENNGQEDNWETTLAQRRIKTGFSIPLKIRFPAKQDLATASHYSGKLSALTSVDTDQIFSIVTLLRSESVSHKTLDANIKDRINSLVQRAAVKQVTLIENSTNRPVYGYRGLSEEQRLLFPETRCVACGQRGFFKCTICESPYCSAHCQREDYKKHKDVCHLKGWKQRSPLLNKTNKGCFEELDGLSQEKFPKGSHVSILSVLTPERVFVRSLEKESNIAYLQTLSDVAKAGLSAEKLYDVSEAGDICLALYQPLNIYARVLITKVSKKQAHCVFIEFGLVELVNIDDLKQLKDEKLKLRKVCVHKVHLKGITEEYGHIEKAMSYLNSLINKPLEMKAQLEGSRNLVDAQLRTVEGISVNKQINQLIIIPVVKVVENIDSFIDYKKIPHKKLPLSTKMDIMILNRTTIKLDFRVTLIACQDLPYLQDLQQKLQSYGKKVEQFTEHYTPRLNELCLIRNMGTWYRGVCLESVGDGRPSVFLCDYGCLLMAKLEDIRKIPPSLAVEVRTTDAKVFRLEEAEKAGVKIDSEFLDIYLEENEPMTVEISEETEFKEFGDTLSKEDTTMLSVIKVPDLIEFIDDRLIINHNKTQSIF